MSIGIQEANEHTQFPHFGDDSTLCPVNRFLNNSKEPSQKTFIATFDLDGAESIIGTATCSIWNGAFPSVVDQSCFSVGIISVLYVVPSFRQNGVGRYLVDQCKMHLKDLGCKQIILSANSQSEADFFEKCGFSVGNVLSVNIDKPEVPFPLPNTRQRSNCDISFVTKGPEYDTYVVSNWKAMWKEAGIPDSAFLKDFDSITTNFINKARASLAYQTFAAVDRSGDEEIICGTVSCQLVDDQSPQMILKGQTRQGSVGTVWAVYVQPEYRCRGIATELMKCVMQYWRSLGCTTGSLMYASQAGRRVYERIGFATHHARCISTTTITTSSDGISDDNRDHSEDPTPLVLSPETVTRIKELIARGESVYPSSSSAGNGHHHQEEENDASTSYVLTEDESSSVGDSSLSLSTSQEDMSPAISILRSRTPTLNAYSDVYLHQLLFALFRQLEALSQLHIPPSHLPPGQFQLPSAEEVSHVVEVQKLFGLFIDPTDNWLTQNVKRFGKGFDMMKLCQDPELLASKFDRLASKYDEWASGNMSKVDSWIAKQAVYYYPSFGGVSTRVLDVACGIGLPSQTTRLCGWQGIFSCTDISPAMVQRAKERGACDDVFVCNMNDGLSQIEDGSYRTVICTGALELMDHGKVLPEFCRVLSEGGMLWASFQLDDSSLTGGLSPTEHQNVKGISREDAISRLESSGFRVIEDRSEVCLDAFYTPSSKQDGSMLPVPYFFVVAEKV